MTDQIAHRSTDAQRARIYRSRRRRGVRLVSVILQEWQVDALVKFGYLDDALRADRLAVQSALRTFTNERLLRDAPPNWDTT